jgi:GAF domain-containing protein
MTEVDELRRALEDRDAEIAELRRRLQAEVSALARLVEITGLLNSTLRLEELLALVMRSAAELLEGEAASLLLVDEESGDLIFEVATREGDERIAGTSVPAGQGIAGWVVEHAESAVVASPGEDPRFYGGIDEASDFETRNLIAIPLKVKDRVIGVVEVINKREGKAFDDKDLEIALALTNQAAIAIDNARLYARLADAVVTARMSYRL